MTRLALLLALASGSGAVLAQTEQFCLQLFGTRETAMRMAQTGFPVETTVRETFARKEWREATPEERGWAVLFAVAVIINYGALLRWFFADPDARRRDD